MSIQALHIELERLSDEKIAGHSEKYFQTQDGGYGAGDRFLGIRVPPLRELAKTYRGISFRDMASLLQSPFHEHRLLALFLLMDRYKRSGEESKARIYDTYLAHTGFINNWDLVDVSAEHIVGAFLWEKDRKPIYDLARSNILWERRIAVVGTFYYIKRNEFSDTLAISEMLLTDAHHLIHKAVGWMLREVGKRNIAAEEAFLNRHYRDMPRTMLRYAIEKFSEPRRKAYLHGKFVTMTRTPTAQ